MGKSRTAIGIDVGSRAIKAAQLSISGHWTLMDLFRDPRKGSGQSYQIVSISKLPRADVGQPSTGSDCKLVEQQINHQEIQNLRSILKRQGFYGSKVVLAAPEERLLRGVFDVPQPAADGPAADRTISIAQIARMELSRMHDVAPDSFELVCWEQPPQGEPGYSANKSKSNRGGGQTTAVGCPHDVANVLLDLFEQSGFNVRALDLRSAAAARICISRTVPAPAVTTIVDLDWDSTKLLFVCGGTIIYERFISDSSIAKINAKLSGMFGITEESADQTISTIGLDIGGQASEFDQESTKAIRRILRKHFDKMLEEFKAPFDYVNHQYSSEGIKRLLLIGDGAKISGLSQYFQNALDIEVISVGPADLVESSPQILNKVANPAMTVAVGLAMFDEG